MIKLIKILAGPNGCHDIGSRINLPAEVEAEIVAAGAGEYIGSVVVAEVAASSERETAQASVQKSPVETRQSPAKAKK